MLGNINMYDYEGHIVQIIKNDGNVVIGWADACETDMDNDIGDAFNIDTGCKHLPYYWPDTCYPVTVYLNDVKSIDIIE
ncbi:MAG: hypothetical protein QM793_08290 [Muricomes sp.]